ncbi:MAG: YgiT-type zinc finger protein [Calditrichaeota bacterium]|nr:YgiT-type zinc finger protein [Calditrichota bacterium]
MRLSSRSVCRQLIPSRECTKLSLSYQGSRTTDLYSSPKARLSIRKTRTTTMSSYHPSVPSNRIEFPEDVLPCAECGRNTLCRVTANYPLDDGTVVTHLEHWKCSSCGEVLFDLESMRQIREARKQGRHPKQRSSKALIPT